ncbi:MAG: diguanylate cyclase, partial [Rhizobiales bacterium]|nr:diguanylate cyclase [Hyphomicrobiales bacterium]
MAKGPMPVQGELIPFPQGKGLLQAVVENAPIGMRLSRQDGGVSFVNQALADMFRTTRSKLAVLSVRELVVPEMVAEAVAQLDAVREGRSEGYRAERLFVRSDGSRFWGLVSVSAVQPDGPGALRQIISQVVDIDSEKRAKEATAEAENRWNFALESAGQGVWDHDLRTGKSFYSRVWKTMRGLDPDQPYDTSQDAWLQRVHPDDREAAREHERLLNSGEAKTREFEYRERRADGRTIWILSRGRAVDWFPDGRVARVMGTDTDVTRLKDTKRQLAIVLETMADGVVLFDADERLVFRNEQYVRLFPATAHVRVPGARLEDILRASVAAGEPVVAGAGGGEGYIARTRAALRSGGEWEFQLSDGRWLEVHARPVADAGGYLSVISDITRRKRAELDQADLNRRLEALAHLDGLTGLINRRAFDELFASELHRSLRERRPLALLMFDVDHFEAFNDAYGHLAGDDCLRAISRALTAALRRPADRAARIGGEEFAVILPDADAAGGLAVGEAIRMSVRDLGI